MVRRPPKDYEEREKEEVQARRGLASFLAQIAGPLIVAIIMAGVVGHINSRSNDLLHDERISSIIGRLDGLQTLVDKNTEARLKGERWTRTEALAKFDEINKILTDMRIEVEGLKRVQTP